MAPTEEEGPPAGERHVAGTTEMRIQMNTSEVLNRAADLIEERGWTAGSGWDHENGGPLCLEGGILAAAGIPFLTGNMSACPAYIAVRDYLSERTDKAPWRWNDRLAIDLVNAAIDNGEILTRSLEAICAEANEWAKNEVISVLRAAAIIAAAQEVDVRVVAPEAELTAVSLADVAGAVTA